MNAEDPDLAGSVRRLRTARRWTLDHAAARLNVSRRLLAQIEAGEANPSLSTLLGIAAGFGVHLTELLGASPEAPLYTVGEKVASAPVLWSADRGSEARLLAGRGALEMWHWTLEPGAVRASEAHSGPSQEALHVLKGVVDLDVGGETVQVGAGGSVLFDADRPHAYANRGRRTAVFLLTVHDPSGA